MQMESHDLKNLFLSAVHKQESSRCISKACHWYSRRHVERILHETQWRGSPPMTLVNVCECASDPVRLS